jgi:CheY-like chemotaxis protein
MLETRAKLLIADDEPTIRTAMSHVLHEIGYHVRTAQDGFSALAEMRRETPDILLSDLNMPGMSGFELLSVVRRRFPSVQTIAMSGAFHGDEVPSGVAADAFYQKGSSVGSLLRIMETLPPAERPLMHQPSSALAPVWIQRSGSDACGELYCTIACPECLRTFSQALGDTGNQTWRTDCIFCGCSIPCAIVRQEDWAHAQGFAHSGQILERQPYQETREPGMAMSLTNPQPSN